MTMLPVTGKRILLRDMILDDLPAWEQWTMPGNAWHELDGPYYPKPSPDDVKKMVTGAQARIETGEWPEPRRGHRRPAGPRYLVVGERGDQLAADREHWGRGLGYEALGLWCDYLLTAMPELARLDLRTWSGNHGMMALARKLGFTEEARFRKARIVRGEYYDGMGYGILREEWDARYWDGFAASL